MFVTLLIGQVRNAWRSWHLRGVAVAVAVVVATVSLVGPTATPDQLLARATWTLFLTGLLVGGCLAGWRVAQFPKSRAIEFHFVTPLSDWTHIGGLVAAGMLRSLVALGVLWPAAAIFWGAGWIGAPGALALVALPLAAGWLAGLVLAVVAYEPAWVRRLIERLVLGTILAYLVLFGLLGHYFVPWVLGQWARLTGTPLVRLGTVAGWFEYFNPFRLLGSITAVPDDSSYLSRVIAVVTLLLLLAAACLWRLVARLRRHYDEENFGRHRERRFRGHAIASNPLAWWTVRRVSQFKGNINLYLAWTTIGLYSAWMLWAERWPTWLASGSLKLVEQYGGETMLAVASLQLAVVPVAFLNGLWDSNAQQRAQRLELLLVSPLSGRQFLVASALAGWVRGQGYVLGMLVLWTAATIAGRLDPAQLPIVCLLAANYLLLSCAVAFRNFARLPGDHAVTFRGLIWSVGIPLVTVGLVQMGANHAAALSPLGGLYFLALSPAQLAAGSDLTPQTLGWIVATSQFVYLAIAVVLMRRALRCFDGEIRCWLEGYHAGSAVRVVSSSNAPMKCA